MAPNTTLIEQAKILDKPQGIYIDSESMQPSKSMPEPETPHKESNDTDFAGPGLAWTLQCE